MGTSNCTDAVLQTLVTEIALTEIGSDETNAAGTVTSNAQEEATTEQQQTTDDSGVIAVSAVQQGEQGVQTSSNSLLQGGSVASFGVLIAMSCIVFSIALIGILVVTSKKWNQRNRMDDSFSSESQPDDE